VAQSKKTKAKNKKARLKQQIKMDQMRAQAMNELGLLRMKTDQAEAALTALKGLYEESVLARQLAEQKIYALQRDLTAMLASLGTAEHVVLNVHYEQVDERVFAGYQREPDESTLDVTYTLVEADEEEVHYDTE
jgi:hypothetical protein